MSSCGSKPIAVGLCKRCGKVIEYTPVKVICRNLGPSCISHGEYNLIEYQRALYSNAKYCSECSKEARRALFKRLLSIPKQIIKRQK